MTTRGDMARSALALLQDEAMRAALAKVDPTAMKNLLAAATQSGSLDEVEVVFRYQVARFREEWQEQLEQRILKLLRDAAKDEKDDEARARAAAEQFGFIARIHKVVKAAQQGQASSDRGRKESGRR